MPKIEPFEKFYAEYEEWFEKNRGFYLSELNGIKSLIVPGRGIEIGVGTGRFAIPLGIKEGVDPSKKMIEIAREKGLTVYEGKAEQLPLKDEEYDFVLMVTTICFLDNIEQSFKEVRRILKNNGLFLIGFVDKNSELGLLYQKEREKSKFYKIATFLSTEEIIKYLEKTSFNNIKIKQTIFGTDGNKIYPVMDSYGKGSFVVIRAMKK